MTTAQEKIDSLLEEAYAAIHAAEEIAEQANLSFSFDVAYGMGGWYYPDEMTKEEALKLLEQGDELYPEVKDHIAKVLADEAEYEFYDEPGWVSSSSSC